MKQYLEELKTLEGKWNASDQKSVTPDFIKEYVRLNNVIKTHSAERVVSIKSSSTGDISRIH